MVINVDFERKAGLFISLTAFDSLLFSKDSNNLQLNVTTDKRHISSYAFKFPFPALSSF
jgi:hypothetical protein